jgi:hypothetical protein
MKILYVLRSKFHFHYFNSTIRQLCADGNDVLALFDEGWSKDWPDKGLNVALGEIGNLRSADLVRRRGLWRRPLFWSRELLNYIRYLNEEGQSPYYRDRWGNYLPVVFRYMVKSQKVRDLLSQPFVKKALSLTERYAPPERKIQELIEHERPDVVVVSPANMRYSEELEYVKAAKAMGVPVAIQVISWDNLTTKGVFHVLPDALLVWNDTQAEEARDLLHVPGEKIFKTGAPVFDPWFEVLSPSTDRVSFLKQVGFDPEKPYVVYLGSSANIAKDETWVVKELAQSLGDDINIMVRPHPANYKVYEKVSLPNVKIWPQVGDLPDTSDKLRDFYNSLYFSVCAVGINTSGMIDSVIADAPTVGIIMSEYEKTQKLALHFQHLLKKDVLYFADRPQGCGEVIRGILNGVDEKTVRRKEFVHDFIRPCGLDVSAGRRAADIIESLGSSKAVPGSGNLKIASGE